MSRSNQRSNADQATGFRPIRPRRAFEEVILQLKEAVVEGRLAVGDRLPNERELAKLFNVSRQSVREGLRMLEGFGVLTARRGVGPDSGWIVSGDGTSGLGVLLDLYTSLQRIPVWDLLEIREALEVLSARSAAARGNARETHRLVSSAKDMAVVSDREKFLQADTEFHVLIAKTSGNTLAPILMEAIREAMARVMLLAFEAVTDWPSERELLVCEHLEIADKIQAGQGDAAAQALSKHIRGFYGRALKDIAAPEVEAARRLSA
jgi:GntR family transcriptional regulator, transcriptional repressor for pyruvate dehydrogenase complex